MFKKALMKHNHFRQNNDMKNPLLKSGKKRDNNLINKQLARIAIISNSSRAYTKMTNHPQYSHIAQYVRIM